MLIDKNNDNKKVFKQINQIKTNMQPFYILNIFSSHKLKIFKVKN